MLAVAGWIALGVVIGAALVVGFFYWLSRDLQNIGPWR